MGQSHYIISVEAKDLYSNQQVQGNEKHGLHIRDKDGNVKTKKFINVLDWSMASEALESIYYKTTRRKDFSFTVGRHSYTKWVINVKFTLSYKLFNKCGKTVYVRAGHSLHNNKLIDGVCVKDGILIAIDTKANVENPQSKSVLGKYFDYENGKYVQKGNIPTLMNCAELRKWAYSEGFYCDGSLYCRSIRSSGSARIGNCLFVLHSLSDQFEKFNLCGLPIYHGDPVDLASLEAYKGLNLSSMIGKVSIQPHEILLIEDRASVFKDRVVAVTAPSGELEAKETDAEIENSLWDGQSLLCSSLFKDYPGKSVLILRNKFFKTAAFATNLKKWFADNGICDVSQLNGQTLAERVEDIKLISTPSSLKYLKFNNDFERWTQEMLPEFAVVKTEKPTKFFDSRLVMSHYQLLNSVQFSYEDMYAVLKPSLDYIRQIRQDPDVLRNHIRFKHRSPLEALKTQAMDFKREAAFKLLGLNHDFARTKIYKDFRSKVINGIIRKLNKGKVLIPGNYSVILGNPLEMLQESIGLYEGKSSIAKETIYCNNFADGEELLGSRSPHILASNILIVKNKKVPEIDKYFNLSKEVVCVNIIGENILQRLAGADQDGDQILLSSHEKIIEKAKTNYDRFLVPTCFLESEKLERKYTDEHRADLDISTSVNLIGNVVNLAQVLSSIYWDKINSGASHDELKELFEESSRLSILSMLEIDKCKRNYLVSGQKELEKLSKKYKIVEGGRSMRPMFFKTIAKENNYKQNDKTAYKSFATPMDFLDAIIKKENLQQSQSCRVKTIPFMDIVREPEGAMPGGSVLYRKEKIIEVVKAAQTKIQSLRIDYKTKNWGERRVVDELVADIIQECVDKINRMSLCEHSMYLALKELDNKENADIRDLLFETLFNMPNDMFFELIRKSSEPMYELIEDENGDINLYGFRYKKVLVGSKNDDDLSENQESFADFDDFLADYFEDDIFEDLISRC